MKGFAHLSLVTDNYSERVSNLGIEPAKLPTLGWLGKGWLGSTSHSNITSTDCMDVKQEIDPKAFIFTLTHSFLLLPYLKPQKN